MIQTPELIDPAEMAAMLDATANGWTPETLKAFQSAVMTYERAVKVYNETRASLTRAEEQRRPAFDKAVRELTAVVGKRNAPDHVPPEIVHIVDAADVAITHADTALKVAARVVNITRRGVGEAFTGYGMPGVLWAAAARVERGPDGPPTPLGSFVWSKIGPTYLLPHEALDHPLARATSAAMNDPIEPMTRAMRDYPGPVGPTSDKHPQRGGKVINGQHVPIEPESLKAYDIRRHRRYVAYWAMCAIVDGAAEMNHDGQLRITAEWRDHAALVAKYSPPKPRNNTAGFPGEPDDDADVDDPKPTRWRGRAGVSVTPVTEL